MSQRLGFVVGIVGLILASPSAQAQEEGKGPQGTELRDPTVDRPRDRDREAPRFIPIRPKVGPRSAAGVVVAAAFSPDGRQIAISYEEGQLDLRDAATGRLVHSLVERPEPKRRDPPQVPLFQDPNRPNLPPIKCLAFSHDGARLAAGSSADDATLRGGLVRIWETATGRLVATFKGHDDPVTGLAFGPRDETITSLDMAYTLKVWRVEDGEELATLAHGDVIAEGGLSPATKTAFAADARRVVSIMPDYLLKHGQRRSLRTWDVGAHRFEAFDYRERFERTGGLSIALSPDGRRILVYFAERDAQFLEFSTGDALGALRDTEDWRLYFLAFSPDGERIVGARDENQVGIWSPLTRRRIQTIRGPVGYVRAVTFLPGRLRVASGGFDLRFEKDPESGRWLEEPLRLWEADLDPLPVP